MYEVLKVPELLQQNERRTEGRGIHPSSSSGTFDPEQEPGSLLCPRSSAHQFRCGTTLELSPLLFHHLFPLPRTFCSFLILRKGWDCLLTGWRLLTYYDGKPFVMQTKPGSSMLVPRTDFEVRVRVRQNGHEIFQYQRIRLSKRDASPSFFSVSSALAMDVVDTVAAATFLASSYTHVVSTSDRKKNVLLGSRLCELEKPESRP
ncbi:hypothetical protein O3P69_008358 [Scylla paramamosain]|uniref:Uncharacterized protein n=1 Tax=Scylla paramamosain TaxID=85552 RepID=A0AAW0SJF0_SCYPA